MRLKKETLMASRIVHRLVAGIVLVAVLSVAGCASDHIASGYTGETRIDGRPVIYRSSAGNEASLKVHNQDTATFGVRQFGFTIDRTRVTWGENQTLALPPNWKRVEFIDEETHVAIRVDGKSLGEIRPAA
jgi:hypothetical protein